MNKRQEGFIDIISLLVLLFLTVTTFTVTSVVSNKGKSLDIRNFAKVFEDAGTTIKKAVTTTKETSTTTIKEVPASSKDSAPAPEPAAPVPIAPPAAPAAPTCLAGRINTAGTCPDGKTIKYVWRNTDCTTKTDECPNTPPPPAPPAPVIPAQPAAPAQQADSVTAPVSQLTTEETRLEKKLCLAEGGTWNNNQCQYPKTAVTPVQPLQVTTPANDLEPEETRYTQQLILPSPTPTPVTITKSDYQKCLDSGNTPSECSGVTQNIGQKITTPAGQKECTPNEKFCSGNALKVCSNSGTWGLTTCSNGCENNSCKSKSASVPPPATPSIPESVYYTPNSLPPQIAAVNPPNDPLSLTQDPMMAATLNQKIQDCTSRDFTQNQCTQAFQKAADTKDTCVALYMLDNPNADVKQTADRCNQERATAALIAAATYVALNTLPSVVNTAGSVWSTAGTTVTSSDLTGLLQTAANIPNAVFSYGTTALATTPWLQTAAAVATLSQLPASIIACQTQGADSPACQYAAMGITAGYYSDVIGSEQALQSSAQQVQSVIEQGFNKFINSSTGNTLFGNPEIGPLDSMYSFEEYTLTSRPQLPSELSPLETYIQTAADLINQGKYTEAIKLLQNQQLAAELGVKIDYGYWSPIPSQFSSTAMTNDDFVNLANNYVAASGQHGPGIVTLPSVGYPYNESLLTPPLPEPLVREQVTVALEEWIHELQMQNNQLLGIPYTGGFSTTQHEDEVALYLYNNLKMQLSEPFLSRYNRVILGLPGYNLTNFPTP